MYQQVLAAQLSGLPCRTALLPLQPCTQAMEVEDVPASELLRGLVRARTHFGRNRCRLSRRDWIPRYHLLAADDARLITVPIEVRSSSVRIENIHVSGRPTVSNEITASSNERAEGKVHVAQDVQGKTIMEQDDSEEGDVGRKFGKVYDALTK